MEDKDPKFAVAPDGRVVKHDPHNQSLKPGWRLATDEDIAAKETEEAARNAPSVLEPEPLPEPEAVNESTPVPVWSETDISDSE